tara:strand:+ start:620 stop:808 length:189 start_codon:yes stop_codon:yes gene_type:complete
MRNRDYLFSMVLLAAVAWMTVGCKKKVEVEQLVPRTYELPVLDEEDLDELPEAGEQDTAEQI